jgi:hypothetical protein
MVRMMESGRMRWTVHVGYMGNMRNACKVLLRKPERKDLLKDIAIDWRIMLKWIFKN